jgi:hypothetical protein
MEQVFRDALEAAKSAARSYSRQPSLAKAEALDAAWRRILALHKISRWRRSPGHSGQRETIAISNGSLGPNEPGARLRRPLTERSAASSVGALEQRLRS